MEKKTKTPKNGILIIFEPIDPDTEFSTGDSTITWKELQAELSNRIKRWTDTLIKLGIRRVEVGSIQWFWQRGKTKGRFVDLNTMFMARLLKR